MRHLGRARGAIQKIVEGHIWRMMPPTEHLQHDLAQHPNKMAPALTRRRPNHSQKTKLCSTDRLKYMNLAILPAKVSVAGHRGGQMRPNRSRKRVSEPLKNANESVCFDAPNKQHIFLPKLGA